MKSFKLPIVAVQEEVTRQDLNAFEALEGSSSVQVGYDYEMYFSKEMKIEAHIPNTTS